MRTNIPHIYDWGYRRRAHATHKATYEGKLAAEVIAGHKWPLMRVPFHRLPIRILRSRMGLTETEANKRSIDYEKPFSGRPVAEHLPWGGMRGLLLLFDKHSRKPQEYYRCSGWRSYCGNCAG